MTPEQESIPFFSADNAKKLTDSITTGRRGLFLLTFITWAGAFIWYGIAGCKDDSTYFWAPFCITALTSICVLVDSLYERHCGKNHSGAPKASSEDRLNSLSINFRPLHNFYHRNRDLFNKIESRLVTNEEFITELQHMLNDISRFLVPFVKGHPSITIMSFGKCDTNPSIEVALVLIRDSETQNENRDIQDGVTKYPVDESNTGLLEVKRKENGAYFNSETKKCSNYNNGLLNWKEYIGTTIVLPIQAKVRQNEKKGENGKKVRSIIGFLVVDSKDDHAFTSDLQEVLAGIADTLFITFWLFKEKSGKRKRHKSGDVQ